MAFFKNLAAMFFCATLCVCDLNAARRTEQEYLNGAHVFFDVQKNPRGLTLIGKELGVETFRASLLDPDFDSFTKRANGNFRVKRLEDTLRMRYRTAEEFFEIVSCPLKLYQRKRADRGILCPFNWHIKWGMNHEEGNGSGRHNSIA
jgi:hypothetical protein